MRTCTLSAERGYDPVLGARPLRRTIQREIEDALSERILFGELKPGTIVVVDIEGEGAERAFTFRGETKSEVPAIDEIVEAVGAAGGPAAEQVDPTDAGDTATA